MSSRRSFRSDFYLSTFEHFFPILTTTQWTLFTQTFPTSMRHCTTHTIGVPQAQIHGLTILGFPMTLSTSISNNTWPCKTSPIIKSHNRRHLQPSSNANRHLEITDHHLKALPSQALTLPVPPHSTAGIMAVRDKSSPARAIIDGTVGRRASHMRRSSANYADNNSLGPQPVMFI